MAAADLLCRDLAGAKPRTFVEAFAFAHLAFLGVDIAIAHAANDPFGERTTHSGAGRPWSWARPAPGAPRVARCRAVARAVNPSDDLGMKTQRGRGSSDRCAFEGRCALTNP